MGETGIRSYSEVAARAVHLFTISQVESPIEAWSKSVSEIFGVETSSAKKGCPRNAFLGLCQEGLVKGIPSGQYTRSRKNKHYALCAVKILQRHPELVSDPNALWKSVMGGEIKKHNSQMDVVVGLWNKELIVKDV